MLNIKIEKAQILKEKPKKWEPTWLWTYFYRPYVRNGLYRRQGMA